MAWATVAAVAAPVIGGLLGGSGGSGGTTTTNSEPWGPAQPYLKEQFKAAQNLYNSQSNAPNQYQDAAMNALMGLNGISNPYMGMDNPYLTKTIEAAQADAMRGLLPVFNQANAASGSFGNSGVAENNMRTASNTLGNLALNARMNAYNNDAATWLANKQLNSNNANNLFTMGTNYGQIPWQNLKNYQDIITGAGGSSSSTPYYQNRGAGILGGALAGAQLYNSLKTPTTTSNVNNNSGWNPNYSLSSGGSSFGLKP